jgi:hypothetical protein
MPYSIDDPKILDGILGHEDDKAHVGEDMSGRIKPRVRDGWTSKKKTRGKKDKWAKYSPRYNDYVRVGETPEHADEPVPMISSRSTEQGRRAHNKSRSRARADRRAYRWSCLRRKRREREHERCAKRYEQRLAKQNNKSTTIKNSQCTLGTRGINAGGDGRKSLRECRCVASSKKPEVTTSGPC